MREQFEKMPEIAEKLHTVVFSESHNTYHAKLINSPLSVMFVQGAWHACQEQQKIIDMQECGATEIQMILDDNEYDDVTKLKRIKELLK